MRPNEFMLTCESCSYRELCRVYDGVLEVLESAHGMVAHCNQDAPGVEVPGRVEGVYAALAACCGVYSDAPLLACAAVDPVYGEQEDEVNDQTGDLFDNAESAAKEGDRK